MRKVPRDSEPVKQWTRFLNNHRKAIAAMDSFALPTHTFGVLYCFFVVTHVRRRIPHWKVTKQSTRAWVVQQLREAFPCDSAPGYLFLHDRFPSACGSELCILLKSQPNPQPAHRNRSLQADLFLSLSSDQLPNSQGTTCASTIRLQPHISVSNLL